MTPSPSQSAWISVLASGVLGSLAVAGPITLSPVAVVGTDLQTFSPTAPLESMINGSGVEIPFVSGVTEFDTYFANPARVFAQSGDGGTNNWQSTVSFDPPLKGTVDFDLGARYRVNKVALWNRSLKEITIKILEELNGPEQVGGSFSLFDRQSFPFSYAAEVLPFTAPLEGRYLRLVIDSTHPIPGFTFTYATVGEIVVSATPLAAAPPSLAIEATSGGDVRVSFTGTLTTSPNPQGPYGPVSGNPQGTYILPKAALSGLQFFRAEIQ